MSDLYDQREGLQVDFMLGCLQQQSALHLAANFFFKKQLLGLLSLFTAQLPVHADPAAGGDCGRCFHGPYRPYLGCCPLLGPQKSPRCGIRRRHPARRAAGVLDFKEVI